MHPQAREEAAAATMVRQGFSVLVNQTGDDYSDESDEENLIHPPDRFSLSQLILFCITAMAIGASVPAATRYIRDNNNMDNSVQQLDNDNGNDDYATESFFNNLRNNPKSLEEESPQLAWLMSFPNSGTSYTLSLMAAASNMTMASNYGWEHSGEDTQTIPVLPQDKASPFWLDATKDRPSPLVLTKTHCGGYCHGCRPTKYTETPHAFLMHCATSHWDAGNVDGNGNAIHLSDSYDYNHINRAIHLIRNPFDNMISRYHLALHQVAKRNNTEEIERYTYSRQGFAQYCTDKEYLYEEEHSNQIDQKVLELIEDIPCHIDMYRFVQWHNLAFIATEDMLKIPTLIVHYEEYEYHFEETLAEILAFLQLPNSGSYAQFDGVSDYQEYFTQKQRMAMRNATMMLASPLLWHHLERYF